MPRKSPLKVIWSENSYQNSIEIKHYLQDKFTEKEIEVFYSLLSTFEEAVSIFPKLYPITKRKSQIRRAVLSKVLSVFYKVNKNQIEVLSILDNRTNLSKWLQVNRREESALTDEIGETFCLEELSHFNSWLIYEALNLTKSLITNLKP